MIREARNEEDLAAFAALWSALRPRDAISVEFVRGKLAREPERLYQLAEHEGTAVGCSVTTGSSYVGRKFVAVGVAPEHRRQGLGTKELVLVALDGEQVVGFAALEDRDREAGVAGNDLTTTRRSHRRRGIAEALKRRQLAWAAGHGYRTAVTGQHETNLGMQKLNEKLGYHRLPETIMLRRSLVEER